MSRNTELNKVVEDTNIAQFSSTTIYPNHQKEEEEDMTMDRDLMAAVCNVRQMLGDDTNNKTGPLAPTMQNVVTTPSLSAFATAEGSSATPSSTMMMAGQKRKYGGDLTSSRSKKPLPTHDEKRMKRIMANRRSARKSRERMKKIHEDLEASVNFLSQRCNDLNQENLVLRNQVSVLTGLLEPFLLQQQHQQSSPQQVQQQSTPRITTEAAASPSSISPLLNLLVTNLSSTSPPLPPVGEPGPVTPAVPSLPSPGIGVTAPGGGLTAAQPDAPSAHLLTHGGCNAGGTAQGNLGNLELLKLLLGSKF